MSEDCLFCTLYRDGDHVASTEGFVAIRDINPQASTHLLVIPERHIESFHRISELTAGEDKRMLDFIAEVAAENALTDYRVVVNAGAGAGQTIFHLHWHVLSGGLTGSMT
jgi:histidine triad (HIT) family protein